MKHLVALFLACAMLLFLPACGGEQNSQQLTSEMVTSEGSDEVSRGNRRVFIRRKGSTPAAGDRKTGSGINPQTPWRPLYGKPSDRRKGRSPTTSSLRSGTWRRWGKTPLTKSRRLTTISAVISTISIKASCRGYYRP